MSTKKKGGVLAALAVIALPIIVVLSLVLLLTALSGDDDDGTGNDCTISSEGGADTIPEEYVDLVEAASKESGIPTNVLGAQIQQESQWNPKAVSSANAQGLTQFIPETWAAYGKGDPMNPADAIAALGRYMKALKAEVADLAGDDAEKHIKLTLAAYNAGPGAVQQHHGVPPYPETQDYVDKILNGGGDFKSTCTASGGKSWDGDLGDGEWTLPIPGGQFTSGYGHRNVPGLPAWAQDHVGDDISTGGGAPIIAPTDMKVVGFLPNDGCVMTRMDAKPNLGFAFCHMSSNNVAKGDKLKRGDKIGVEGGFMGGSPNGAAAHLHIEIYKPNCGQAASGGMNTPYDGCNLDPEPLLKEKGAWPK